MALTDYRESSFATPETGAEEGEFWSLAKCKRAYVDYAGSKFEEIQEQRNARCYRHGAQWTTKHVETFNNRRQPVVTYNRVGRKIDSIVGLMEKLRQDPKAYPRNPNDTDETGAELATAAVRAVIDAELRENNFPFAIENGAVDGIGGVEMMLIEGDKGDQDIGFALIESDAFFYDPRSYRHSFEDARYMGQAKWLDVEDAQALAPDKAEEIGAQGGGGGELTANVDRDRHWFSMDPDNKRIRVVDLWYKSKGQWNWCMFTGAMKIDEGRSYFFDEKKRPVCKYIMFSAFVDHDGDRYGFVRNLRSSQDEINQRRSKGLHELMSRRIKAEDGAFGDIETARREAVRPDGVVIYNKGFEMEFDDAARQANIDGQFKFLEDAKNEIENFGPSPALIGQGLEYKSGRAINLLQQAGIAELGPFVVNVRNWKLRLYRAIWCAVQRYWTQERWIRVTDNQGIQQQVQINGLQVSPVTGLPQTVNAVGQLDVNFVLDEGPDEINMMADAYDTLTALTAQGANIPPAVLLELSPLHSSVKKKLLGMLQKPDPAAEQAKQLSLAAEAAGVDETKSKTALNLANVQKIGGDAQNLMATGVIERQLDAQGRQQEFQIKQSESASKLGIAQEQARMKSAAEFAKMHAAGVKNAQEIQASSDKVAQDMTAAALRHAQAMRMAEEKHQMALRQAAAAPKGGQNASST